VLLNLRLAPVSPALRVELRPLLAPIPPASGLAFVPLRASSRLGGFCIVLYKLAVVLYRTLHLSGGLISFAWRGRRSKRSHIFGGFFGAVLPFFLLGLVPLRGSSWLSPGRSIPPAGAGSGAAARRFSWLAGAAGCPSSRPSEPPAGLPLALRAAQNGLHSPACQGLVRGGIFAHHPSPSACCWCFPAGRFRGFFGASWAAAAACFRPMSLRSSWFNRCRSRW